MLGGTFDPVHNAHLAMARAALEQLALDRIVWIPTGRPGYRRPAVASPADRLAMLRLALAGEPRYVIDERELRPDATGYTVHTLEALARERPEDEVFLLLGADQHAAFETWHRPRDIERLVRIAVVERPGVAAPSANGATTPATSDATMVAMEPMPVSASDIRERAARGAPLDGLVPGAVANYIAEKRLYR